PSGFFHSAISRDMLISWGIPALAQVARYFSQAHLYLKGTSWLTSVWPLMMRLSAAFTRPPVPGWLAAAAGVAAAAACGRGMGWSLNRPVGWRAASGCA